MNLVGIMPARNEGWVIGLSARAALMYCDSLVILDHASTDDTGAIAEAVAAEYPGRVAIIEEPSEEWAEMDHRQRLLDTARAMGCTHVAPIDADEVLSGELLPSIRGQIERLRAGAFAGIPMRNLHRSIDQYRSDNSDFGSRAGTMLAFGDTASAGWARRNGYDHHQRAPRGTTMGHMIHAAGGIMHLQFANWRRLLEKHAHYKVMERCKYPSKSVAEINHTYSHAPNEGGLALSAVPADWWAPYAEIMRHLDLDREPWQGAEVRRIIAARGPGYFAGLNLFGVENVQ